MKRELFAGLSTLLFPMCMYASPPSGAGAYQRSYLRSSVGKQQPLLHSSFNLSVKQKSKLPDNADELTLLKGKVVRELVVIDAAVPDKHILKREVKPGVDVIELQASLDGLQQLTMALEQYRELEAVHIVSHAESGRLWLGNAWVNAELLKERLEFFASLNDAIKDGGDLLLYGCELAASEQGDEFIDILSVNTHADIAASDDLTGGGEQDGDWDLEIKRGTIEAELAFDEIALKDFDSVLAINDGTGATINTSGFPQGGAYTNTRAYSPEVGYSLTLASFNNTPTAVAAMYCGPVGYCTVDPISSVTDAMQLHIYFAGGQQFDIDSLQAYTPLGNNTYIFTPSSGSPVNTSAIDTSVGFATVTLNFTGITRLTITRSGGLDMDGFSVDNLIIKNAGPVNNSPAISIANTTLAYTEGNAATQIDSAATVSDADGDADWNGGTLVAQVTANAEAGDRLSVSDTDGDGTAITISGLNIFSNATDIGDLSASGGVVTGGTALTITFDADATNANVQEVLQSIRYDSTTNDPGTSNRTVTVTATDTNSGANADTRTISVTAVNDEPSLTTSGSDPTFTEGGSAASLFSSTSISTVESGQTISALTLTVANVTDGSNERLNADGTSVVLTHGTSGTTATNSLSYSVSVSGTTATVSFTGGTMSTAAAQTMVNGLSYQNNSNNPNTSNRVVTLTSMQDSGGTANSGDDTVALSDVSTVTVVGNNDEPTLTATGSNPTFTEAGATATLYSGTSISTVEAGQTISELSLTVTNVNDGSNEILNADGSTIGLVHGNSGSTATNSLNYNVSVSGTTATVAFTGGILSILIAENFVDGLGYVNNSQEPSTSNRVVTLTSVRDNGGTLNGGDDTAALSVVSTVTVVTVNDEPTLTASGSNPTFIEGGSAASLYSSASASTVEAGQTISALTLTVTNVNDGSNERLNADGTTIVLTHGTSGTTATNSLSYSVSVSGTTATVSFSGGTLSTAATQTLIDGLSYQNNSQAPNSSNRVVTITSIRDSGGTANGGDDTAALAITSTVIVIDSNDEPSLTATGSDPTFTEGSVAATLFSGTSIGTVESGQTIAGLTLTVTNVNNGSGEILNVDGTGIALTNGNSGSTLFNTVGYSVSVVGTTATLSMTSGSLSIAAAQTIIDAMSYQNDSQDPNTSNRVVTLTSIRDSGGTANGGDDTAALSIPSTVTVTSVNDEPTLTVTGDNPTFTEGGSAAGLFSSANASTVEVGQTLSTLTLTVSNVNDGSNEQLDIDGSTVALTNMNSGTTATNSLSFNVSVSGTTATVTLSGGTLSTAATQTLVNGLSYQNLSNTPNTSSRVVTLTSLRDSGGTANGGDDTAALALGSTVTVVQNNDEPSLTATSSNPTFIEGGSSATLFGSASIGTVESAQTIIALTLIVTNVNDGSNEILNADGSAIPLTNGATGVTPTNSLTYNVNLSGTTATVSFTSGTMSIVAAQTLVDNLSYQNNADALNTSNRVVTITTIQDSGGTANGGDDTAVVAIASTVTVVDVNDEPTLTATANDPTFTEGSSAADLFNSITVSTIESGQTISDLSLTVTNVSDGSNERLNVDGSVVLLTNGASGTTATNSLSYSVSVSGSTATISLSGGTLSAVDAQTVVDGLSYQNNSDTPTTSNRVVTLTGIQDSGGVANGGDDSAVLSIPSTVTVVQNNDEPTLTATASNPTFTEGGAAAGLFNLANADTIEGGQTISELSFTVSNVNNGSDEIINADGSAITLTNGASGTTTTNTLSYSVTLGGNTATVDLSSGTMSVAAAEMLVNSLSYQNNSQAPDTSNRVVTLNSIRDSGGVANGGDDTAALAIASTVTVVGVNDPSTDIALSSNTVDQSLGVNALVGDLSTTDIDTSSFTYTLVAGTGDTDNSRFNISGNQLRANDTGTMVGGNYSVRVNSNDGANDYAEAFTVTVINPVDTDGDTIGDVQEGIDGTDPNDPNDYLDITNPVVTAPADIVLNADSLFTEVTIRQLLGLASNATDAAVQTALDALATDNVDGANCCNTTPLTVNNGTVRLPPGNNTITWQATDRKNNNGSDTQNVQIRPLVSISKDQIGVEGAAVGFKVLLNGPALSYPYNVPFTIDGASTAANPSDHDLVAGNATFTSGTETTVTVNLVNDGAGDDGETLIVNLDTSPVDVNGGIKTQHIMTITENNVAPNVTLTMQQSPPSSDTVLITPSGGLVRVTATVVDLNASDTHTYDWSGTASQLTDTDGDTANSVFEFDPTSLTAGVYSMRVFVEDNNSASDTTELAFSVVLVAPTLGTGDTDGDTVNDVTEGTDDSDSDGIPDYLDNITASNVVPETVSVTNAFLLECDPGVLCRLGREALAGAGGGVLVPANQVVEDTTHNNIGGLFDFEIHELPTAGQSVRVVIPQVIVIPEDAVYRKLANGVWSDFVEDSNNALHSVAGQAGFCPPPGDAAWQPGLTAGHYCLQLTIEDGGPNDADGLVNNSIKDPGGVALALPPEIVEVLGLQANIEVEGGGGALSWRMMLLVALLSVLIRCRPQRRLSIAKAAIVTLFFFAQIADAENMTYKFYIELTGYEANGTHSPNDIVSGMADDGVTATVTNFDDIRSANQFTAGYYYNAHNAVELGYLDLGKVDFDLDVPPTDVSLVSTAIGDNFPISGKGWTLSNRYRYLIVPDLEGSVEAGVYIWEGDINVSNQAFEASLEDVDGAEFLFGFGFHYWFHEDLSAQLHIKRIVFNNQEVDLVGLGVSWKIPW